MARFLEDFRVGEEIWTPGRTITETDVVSFAGLSGDYNPAHTDHQFAGENAFGRPIAHGLLALVVSAGLADRDGSLDGTAIALLGVDWQFKKPVFFGDTLRLHITVENTRVTSKPDRGVLSRRVEVVNQRDEVVQTGSFTTMVKTKTFPRKDAANG